MNHKHRYRLIKVQVYVYIFRCSTCDDICWTNKYVLRNELLGYPHG